MKLISGFVEIEDGLWYEESTGFPWTTRKNIYLGYHKGFCHSSDGQLKRINTKNKYGYYYVYSKNKLARWHRLVYEFFEGKIPKGKIIDHISGNIYDNRIENLQAITQKENVHKGKLGSVGKVFIDGCYQSYSNPYNTTGFTGVTFSKKARKFRANIRVKKVLKHLGYFNTAEDAHKAYLQAVKKYHILRAIS